MGAVDLAVAFVAARPACRRVEREAQHNPRPYARPHRSAHTPHRLSTHAASRIHHSKPAPEARHNLAHRGSGGKTRKKYPERRFTLRACLWQGRAGGATHASHHNIREPPNPHPRTGACRRQASLRHPPVLALRDGLMHYVAITSEGKEDGVPLKDELEAAVYDIVRASWAKRNGYLVPEPSDLQLGNDAVNLRAAVLYADLQDSTKLVDTQLNTTAAEVYKSYMVCAARIIKNEGGSVTAYDGDRIMGVFLGDTKSDAAAKSALRINWALGPIVNPYLKRIYGESAYQAKHVIGVDMSNILACRIGVRNDNDLVWI